MKKLFLLTAILFIPAMAIGEVGIVYVNEAAIQNGRMAIGPMVPGGVVVNADPQLLISTSAFAGSASGDLHHATVDRFDRDLGAILVRLAEPVTEESLKARHRERGAAMQSFLPVLEPAAGDPGASGSAEVNFDNNPFAVEINGVRATDAPVELQAPNRKTVVKFQFVNTSTTPVWSVSVKLRSEPPLLFWKKGRPQTLTDVPRPEFSYGYQAFLKPVAPGQAFSVPVEVFKINEDAYRWMFHIESKNIEMDKDVAITIQPRSKR